MMDLDYFKSINDGYGHVEGDNALRMTAEALKDCVNYRHFIARYGGDEFAAVCELDGEEQIQDFCREITAAIQKKSDCCPYKLSMSIGYAEYSQKIKSDQEFIRLADEKLYQAKQLRKKGYSLYER